VSSLDWSRRAGYRRMISNARCNFYGALRPVGFQIGRWIRKVGYASGQFSFKSLSGLGAFPEYVSRRQTGQIGMRKSMGPDGVAGPMESADLLPAHHEFLFC
jgi:hypothetical protein